jgi:hypothetical protein
MIEHQGPTSDGYRADRSRREACSEEMRKSIALYVQLRNAYEASYRRVSERQRFVIAWSVLDLGTRALNIDAISEKIFRRLDAINSSREQEK